MMSATPVTPRMIGSAHEERRFTVPESSRQTDAPLSRALAIARDALAAQPAGLLTDFDGTLSPIVADHRDARLARGAESALERLTKRLAVVAVITGRAPLDARRLAGLPGLLVVGNHGTEWLEPDAEAPASTPEADAIRDAVGAALRRVAAVPEASIEAKGISATVHYRRAADPSAARSAILDAIGAAPPGVELREGRMSVELRPTGLGDKGSATRAVVERFGLRGVVAMGDDSTDLDMFAAVAAMRAARTLTAAIVAVGGSDREVPPEVSAAADVSLRDPAEVVSLLERLAG
jgi:trehalose 6-phosphate phosphatase